LVQALLSSLVESRQAAGEEQHEEAAMKISTSVKAGGLAVSNHNEKPARGPKVARGAKAGAVQLLNRYEKTARGLKVASGVKAGGVTTVNHTEKPARDSRSRAA
jgi:hypothetical protein